jgi:hypothetical protein
MVFGAANYHNMWGHIRCLLDPAGPPGGNAAPVFR